MFKKRLYLAILFLGLMVIGAACSPSATDTVEDEPAFAEATADEEEEEPEYLPGEISEDEQQLGGVLIGEVDPADSAFNASRNSNTDNLPVAGEISVRVFNMVARQFDFAPDVIKVKKGNKVILNITSEDVEHGFTIEEYNINKIIPAGESITIEFIADKAGSFDFYCSIYCGVGHSNMRGRLIVE
jgi:cytochrome c oxidase subunit 2